MVDIRDKVEELVIARDGGMWLIGVKVDEDHLAPVFELGCNVTRAPGQRGQTVMYGAMPLLLLEDLDSWALSTDAPTWPVKGMSVEQHLRQAFEGGCEAAAGLKMARGRVVLASAIEVPR
jgi:hypothetical protein